MHQDNETKRGLLGPLTTMTIVTLLLVWSVTSLTNGDPLWFLKHFSAEAERFVVYWDGTVHTIEREAPAYGAIMDTFAAAIARPAGYEGRVALSEESIRLHRQEYRMLEVVFTTPVQVHTRHPMPEAATYLVPLSRTHATMRRAFAFPGRVPHAIGPLNLSQGHFDSLYQTVESSITLAAAQ